MRLYTGMNNMCLMCLVVCDEWVLELYRPQDLPSDDSLASTPTSPTAKFLYEVNKLYNDNSYHLCCKEDFSYWLAEGGCVVEASILKGMPREVGTRFATGCKFTHGLAVLWPLMIRYLTEVLIPKGKAIRSDGKPNILVQNMGVYAGQEWRHILIRGLAIVYSDLVAPAFYESVYGDNQSEVGAMVRALAAEITKVSTGDALKQRLADQVPLVDPSTFTVLQDAKVSPHRQRNHNTITAAARQETDLAKDEHVLPLLDLMLPYMLVGLRHYFRDHLGPDGRFAPENTSVAMKKKLLLVSSHNVLPEELFARLDHWYTSRTKSALLSSASSTIMAQKNDTLQWLYSLTSAERELYQATVVDENRQAKVIQMDRSQTAAARAHRAESDRQIIQKQQQKNAGKANDMTAAFSLKLFVGADELDAAITELVTGADADKLVKQHLKAYRVMWKTAHPQEKVLANSGLLSAQTQKPLWVQNGVKRAEMICNLKLLIVAWQAAPVVAPANFQAAADGPTFIPIDPRQPRAQPLAADSTGRQKLAKNAANLLQSAKKADKIIRSLDPVREVAEEEP